jgi:hypothetical protein
VSCRVVSCPVVSCRVLSCPVVSCRVDACCTADGVDDLVVASPGFSSSTGRVHVVFLNSDLSMKAFTTIVSNDNVSVSARW